MSRAKSWQEAETMLRATFPAKDILWRVQSANKDDTRATVLAYVDVRAVRRRLTEVFGLENWEVTYHAGPAGGVLCSLGGRIGGDSEWIIKQDGADNTDIEAIKGGISDACKRAGACWSIGEYLYDLPRTMVDLRGQGENFHKCKDGKYKYWNTPQLPDWALPEDEKGEVAGGPVEGAGDSRRQSAVPREPVPSPEDMKIIKALITSNLQGIAETFPDQYADMAGTECRSLLDGKAALTGANAWSKEALDGLRSWLKAEYGKHQPKAGAGKEDENTGEGGVDQGSSGANLPPGESSKAPADDYPEGATLVVALKDMLAMMLTYAEPGSVTEQTCNDIKSALTTYGNTKSGKALREKAIRGHWLD